jgi:glutaredoxin-dependent peroxiredoxin
LQARVADQSKFDALDIQLIAIGSSNPFSQKTFVDSLKATYPFLSDYPDLKVIKQFDILQYVGEEKRPMAKGSVFLVDKQGIIRGKWMGQEGVLLPSDLFLGVVKELEGKS